MPEKVLQLYCPQCDAPVEVGASKCTKCPAQFGEGSAWKPAAKVSTSERLRQWRQSFAVPTLGQFIKIGLLAACAGVAFAAFYFVAFFFIWAAVARGGGWGPVPLPAHIYGLMDDVARKVLGVLGISIGSLFPMSYFWGAVAGAGTFAILLIRTSRRAAKAL